MIKFMDLNKETAMRLWNKTFGKKTTVEDYTGRKIVKGAYNNRNSKFGWNVDHIYPQSKGGATNDSNLIVCHILTNDEKANKFPCYTANEKKFEIRKVQNHYEIINLSDKSNDNINDNTDFLDHSSGIRLFEKLKGIQNEQRFVGSVFIKLENIKNTAIIDFIEELFDEENISFDVKENFYSTITTVMLKNYDIRSKEYISNLLDNCVVLNTYLGNYFMGDIISNYDIFYRVDCFSKKSEMYAYDKKINFNYTNNMRCENCLHINELVVLNTNAEKDIQLVTDYSGNLKKKDYTYDYVYTKLKDNLIKEVSKR